MVSHTTIVFTRYIILEWIRRNQNDQKTYGVLFLMFCDDIQDMDLTSALQSLMALFVEHILTLSTDITSIIKCKISEWIASQAAFIRAYLEISAGKVEYFSKKALFYHSPVTGRIMESSSFR